jgi:hypothetical protein
LENVLMDIQVDPDEARVVLAILGSIPLSAKSPQARQQTRHLLNFMERLQSGLDRPKAVEPEEESGGETEAA